MVSLTHVADVEGVTQDRETLRAQTVVGQGLIVWIVRGAADHL